MLLTEGSLSASIAGSGTMVVISILELPAQHSPVVTGSEIESCLLGSKVDWHIPSCVSMSGGMYLLLLQMDLAAN